MTSHISDYSFAADEEPLQLDDQGIPILHDVIISGEQLSAAGITLPPAQMDESARQSRNLILEQRIQEAIDAALPKVTERTAAAMRSALFKEVQDSLQESEQQADSLLE